MTGALNSSETTGDRKAAGLTGRIIRFSDFLKRCGFKVSPSATREAVGCLLEIDPFTREDFFNSLRTNLAKTDAEWHQFGGCFEAFWGRQADESERPSDAESHVAPPADRSAVCEAEILSLIGAPSAGTAAAQDGSDCRTSYSPLPAAETKITLCFDQGDVRLAGRVLKNMLDPFKPYKSRRHQKTRKTAAIDFSLVMRRSLKYEGLPLELHYKKRKQRMRRAVFLIDVSGSMDRYARMLLPIILSLRLAGSKPEIFVFSTALVRITAFVRRMHTDQVMEFICRHVPDWSGGTRIGRSLHEFNRDKGRRLLSRRTVVVIFSDGWDLGEKELLRAEMIRLRRRVNRIIWLNPLAGSADYQPVCQGMKTALPHIDHFLPAGDLESLRGAAHLMARAISC